jgi:hypothetical protein
MGYGGEGDWVNRDYVSKLTMPKCLFELGKVISKKELLKQQTEMFWLLQLQFLSLKKDSEAAYNTLYGIYFSPIYKKNKHTRKVKRLMFSRGIYNWTDADFECLCTHFALQLAGVEE